MRTVKLSERASVKLEKLLVYLETEWSYKVKSDFVKKLDKAVKRIQKYPESCQQTEFIKGLHKLVVTKQTSIYYRFDSKNIYIVTIFDNRMEPNKLKNEIE
jgi:plasmid stabilization system protein ParE